MAIKKDVNIKVTYTPNIHIETQEELSKYITVQNAYIKVTRLLGDKDNINFIVDVYENAEKLNLLYVKEYDFVPNVEENSPNFIQQAYEYLKTLPEYADALDC